jgi:heat shock protein HspQ
VGCAPDPVKETFFSLRFRTCEHEPGDIDIASNFYAIVAYESEVRSYVVANISKQQQTKKQAENEIRQEQIDVHGQRCAMRVQAPQDLPQRQQQQAENQAEKETKARAERCSWRAMREARLLVLTTIAKPMNRFAACGDPRAEKR